MPGIYYHIIWKHKKLIADAADQSAVISAGKVCPPYAHPEQHITPYHKLLFAAIINNTARGMPRRKEHFKLVFTQRKDISFTYILYIALIVVKWQIPS
jgi:hypothetical protein